MWIIPDTLKIAPLSYLASLGLTVHSCVEPTDDGGPVGAGRGHGETVCRAIADGATCRIANQGRWTIVKAILGIYQDVNALLTVNGGCIEGGGGHWPCYWEGLKMVLFFSGLHFGGITFLSRHFKSLYFFRKFELPRKKARLLYCLFI